MKMPYVDPKDHEQLFKVTEELRRAYLNPNDITAGRYAALLNETCGALTKSIDGGFEQIVRAAADRARDPEYAAAARGILSDARAFAGLLSDY